MRSPAAYQALEAMGEAKEAMVAAPNELADSIVARGGVASVGEFTVAMHGFELDAEPLNWGRREPYRMLPGGYRDDQSEEIANRYIQLEERFHPKGDSNPQGRPVAEIVKQATGLRDRRGGIGLIAVSHTSPVGEGLRYRIKPTRQPMPKRDKYSRRPEPLSYGFEGIVELDVSEAHKLEDEAATKVRSDRSAIITLARTLRSRKSLDIQNMDEFFADDRYAIGLAEIMDSREFHSLNLVTRDDTKFLARAQAAAELAMRNYRRLDHQGF